MKLKTIEQLVKEDLIKPYYERRSIGYTCFIGKDGNTITNKMLPFFGTVIRSNPLTTGIGEHYFFSRDWFEPEVKTLTTHTILVVFANSIRDFETRENSLKKYCYNVNFEIKPGTKIECGRYNNLMFVVDVLPLEFKTVVSSTTRQTVRVKSLKLQGVKHETFVCECID